MKKLDIIFAGTPDISAKVLKDLYASDHNILAILTQPDRAKGRGKKIQFSPVKEIALEYNIPVLQPLSFKKNPEILQQIRELKPDIIVVIAYGIIVPKEFLDIPKYSCLNIHVSLLPKWRGAAPIQRAIQAGDDKTGICIMQMDEGLDTGYILNTLEIDITDIDTSQTLHDKFARLSIKPLLETLEDIENIQPIKQSNNPTYAHKITKDEGLLDFSQTAKQISCHIRAFTPWPSSFFIIDGETIKVGEFEILDKTSSKFGYIVNISSDGFDVGSSDKIIRFKQLQFPNKKMLNILDIINGKDLSSYIGRNLQDDL